MTRKNILYSFPAFVLTLSVCISFPSFAMEERTDTQTSIISTKPSLPQETQEKRGIVARVLGFPLTLEQAKKEVRKGGVTILYGSAQMTTGLAYLTYQHPEFMRTLFHYLSSSELECRQVLMKQSEFNIVFPESKFVRNTLPCLNSKSHNVERTTEDNLSQVNPLNIDGMRGCGGSMDRILKNAPEGYSGLTIHCKAKTRDIILSGYIEHGWKELLSVPSVVATVITVKGAVTVASGIFDLGSTTVRGLGSGLCYLGSGAYGFVKKGFNCCKSKKH